MGIVKFKLRRPENDKCAQEGDKHTQQRSFSHYLDELNQQEMAVHDNPEDDSDSDEFEEVGCESVALGDQIFGVPYDLFDLLDLKSILSLDTWNTCLTEEERFSLSAYLPDMDQETFWLTMNELLTGEEIFFGSPSAIFFQRLKSGFYSMKATCFREGLQVLEKRKYYHSLRSYHENLVQVFMDMKRMWSTCQQNVSVEERVCIWKKRKDSKPVFIVDLNAFPEDEDLHTKNEKDMDGAQSIKRTKFTDNKKAIHQSMPVSINKMVLPTSLMKPKGVLKIKSVKTTTALNNAVQALPNISLGDFRPTPTGVLKVKPRYVTVGLEERPVSVQGQSELASSVALLGLHASSRLSPMIHSTSKGEFDNFYDDSHNFHPKVRDSHYSGSELPMYLRKPRGEPVSQVTAAMESRETTVPGKRSTKKYFRRASGVEYQNVDSLRRNSSLWNSELCSSSSGSDRFISGYCHERRLITPLTSSTVSRISRVGNDGPETFAESFDPELRHSDLTGRGLTNPSERVVSEVQADGLAFPITYKRKKAYLKQSSSHMKSMGDNYECRVPQAVVYPDVEKTKPVKNKLKF